MNLRRLRWFGLLALLPALLWAREAAAYSLLTHEELIDLAWKQSIVPLLMSHYPGLTAAQLDEARAYAYGGCVIQDIGYYPFGDVSFSNLTHYVRSGDFVVNLFRNAHNADELAFAVGALSHYIGDSVGHSVATNRAVPVEFPRLETKYGHVVTYAEGKHQHVQTEFAFDIDQIAHHRMAPLKFMRHIGLKVPVKQLALAYYQTYGITEDFSARRGRRINVRGYRFAVHTFIPRIAYAVTLLHRRHEPPEPDTAEAAEIEKEVAALSVENNWDFYRRKAGIGTYTLAGFLFILPKFGPLALVAVKGPSTATEADYLHSVALSITILRRRLAAFTPPLQGGTDGHAAATDPDIAAMIAAASPDALLRSTDPNHPLPNRDLDTGHMVEFGGYPLTDSTYALLLHRITQQPTQAIPPGAKQDIQTYFGSDKFVQQAAEDPDKWKQVVADLATLKGMPTSTEPQPYPTYGDEASSEE